MFCFLLDRPLLFLSTVIFPLCHLLWHISARGLLIRIKTVLKRMSWVVCHLKGFFLRYLSRLSIMLWDAPFITQWVNDRSYLWITYSLCGPIVTKFLGRPGQGTGSRVEGRHFIKLWYEGGIHLWNDKLLCGTRPWFIGVDIFGSIKTKTIYMLLMKKLICTSI